jgi:hypothetical protein
MELALEEVICVLSTREQTLNKKEKEQAGPHYQEAIQSLLGTLLGGPIILPTPEGCNLPPENRPPLIPEDVRRALMEAAGAFMPDGNEKRNVMDDLKAAQGVVCESKRALELCQVARHPLHRMTRHPLHFVIGFWS